ncbi:MAG: rubredoxin [Bacteroidales bacterium]|nr:rubredoxin [Bacteroidales bacterium]
MNYVCTICGYVHNEDEQGVKFEQLPDDYVCPVCGVGKEMFEPEQ